MLIVNLPIITIVFRFVLLQKKTTLVKLIAAAVVLIGLLISLIPVISGMDQDSKEGNRKYLQQSRASQILWPLCFMFGFVSFIKYFMILFVGYDVNNIEENVGMFSLILDRIINFVY